VLKSRLNISLKLLFDEWKLKMTHAKITSYKNDPYGWNKFLQITGLTFLNKFELKKYLEEESANLNILDWWKINSCRFSNITQELLVMHVSTVASEYIFSIGGGVFDPYCSLSHQKVETLNVHSIF